MHVFLIIQVVLVHVHVFLFLQALLLLLPSRLWASLEGGRVASLCLAEVRENYTNIEGWRVSVESFIYTLKQNNW